jgi:hypothetical protein
LGLAADTPAALLAEDSPAAAGNAPPERSARGLPALTAAALGENGFRLEAVWPQVKLARTLEIRDGLVHWRETWTNTGGETLRVPCRHRMFLRQGGGRFTVGGSPDNVSLASSAANPTLFVEPSQAEGAGYGLAAESDWWRLLLSLRALGHVGELYTNCLALAPGKSLDLEMTITPVPGGGGYWGFINALRRRWGVNGPTMERPMFWGYARPPEVAAGVEQLRASLGHLGPITAVLGPWQRLEPDARVIRAGLYPKLPADAPRTVGKCPDLDVDAFLTFKHREAYWDKLMAETRALREAVPGIRIIQMTHPAMEYLRGLSVNRFLVVFLLFLTRRFSCCVVCVGSEVPFPGDSTNDSGGQLAAAFIAHRPLDWRPFGGSLALCVFGSPEGCKTPYGPRRTGK